MDLRPYKLTDNQIDTAISFIKKDLLCYQPYILRDTLEVGEGQNFHDGYDRKQIYKNNVYADYDLGLGRPQASDLAHFRACNADYRKLYESFADQLVAHFGAEFPALRFAEIGTNSGLHLFNLATRGAKHCIGYDWNDMSGLFRWLNEILGTQVNFKQTIWNRFTHELEGVPDATADVMISSVVLNHQVDYLQHLAFLCDNAKRAVFLWVLTEPSDADDGVEAAWQYRASKKYYISYCEPNALHPLRDSKDWPGNPFPTCYDHGICISEPLLKRSLQYLGFDEIHDMKIPDVAPGWQPFVQGFRPYLAIRTRDAKSGYATLARHSSAPAASAPVAAPASAANPAPFLHRLRNKLADLLRTP